MYLETSERYKKAIYNTSLQSVVNIYIDEVLLNPKYLLDFKTGCELFEDNLELGSVPSQYIEMKIHKKAGITKPNIIRIEYGILINNALTVEEVNKMLVKDLNKLLVRSLSKYDNSFEIIPIGIYNIDDYNEEDDNVINIKALDNIIKLDADDGYYDASELINENGEITLGEIAQDICDKKGLELVTSSFLNSNKKVSVYDNQIKAREYMSYIAECAGCFCRANREGKIEFRNIGQDTAEIPLRLFKDYKFGDECKITKVAFEDGIRSFKFGNETRNTLWIRQDNVFIVDEAEVQNIYNQINGLTINSFEGTVIIDPAIDIGDKIKIGDKYIIYQGEMSLNKRFIADIKSKINTKEKQETTIKEESKKTISRKIRSEINQLDGKITQIAEQQEENTNKISEHTQTIEGFTTKVSNIETRVDNLDENIDTTVGELVDNKVNNKMQNYPTRVEMNSTIDQKAESITSNVEESKTATISTILTLLNNGYLTAEQVNALVNGNAEDIITIKEQLKQTITNSQMQIEISKAIEGGVEYLKNTLFTIDEKGMAIATNQDEFNALYNNKGMFLYSYDQLIARYDKDGAYFKTLEITGELRTKNLRVMDVVVNGENRTHIHWIGD